MGRMGKTWKQEKCISSLSPELSGTHHHPPSSPFFPRNEWLFHLVPLLLLTGPTPHNLALVSPPSTMPRIILLKEKSHRASLLLKKSHCGIRVSSGCPLGRPRSRSFTSSSLTLVPVLLLPLISPAVEPHKHFGRGRALPFSVFATPFPNFCPPCRKIVLQCLLLWTAYPPPRHPCPSQAPVVALSF